MSTGPGNIVMPPPESGPASPVDQLRILLEMFADPKRSQKWLDLVRGESDALKVQREDFMKEVATHEEKCRAAAAAMEKEKAEIAEANASIEARAAKQQVTDDEMAYREQEVERRGVAQASRAKRIEAQEADLAARIAAQTSAEGDFAIRAADLDKRERAIVDAEAKRDEYLTKIENLRGIVG